LTDSSSNNSSNQEIDLKDPRLAAFLALLWPGLGHIYQHRYTKGILFMVCILGLFIFGWNLGGQRVVYASWHRGDYRWHYFCQVWVGLPAWPAMLQSLDNGLLGKEFMRQPSLTQSFTAEHDQPTELDLWQLRHHSHYEMGTIFTMVAGLLNLLVIFDAAAGPVGSTRSDNSNLQRSLSDAPP
jgi:hypothetical protein